MRCLYLVLSIASLSLLSCTVVAAQANKLNAVLDALQSGDKAKMDKAIESIETERMKLTDGLRKILEDNWDERDENTDAIKCALTALGKLKAVESVDLLIKYIDFSIYPPKRRELGSRFVVLEDQHRLVSPHIEYPAVSALIEIGPCIIDSLLDAVAGGNLTGKGIRNVGWIIRTLFHDDGEARIRSFASGLKEGWQKERVLCDELLMYYK